MKQAESSSSKCVLTVNGTVRCFGDNNDNGLLGYGDNSDRYDASVIGDVSLGSDKIIQLDVGHAHSCALTNKGEVRCWGDGKDGALAAITIYLILVMTNILQEIL